MQSKCEHTNKSKTGIAHCGPTFQTCKSCSTSCITRTFKYERPWNLLLVKIFILWKKKKTYVVFIQVRLNAIWRTWMIKNTILPCYWSKVVNCAGLLLRWQWVYSGWCASHLLLASKNHSYTKTTNLFKPSIRNTVHWACRGHAGADTWA